MTRCATPNFTAEYGSHKTLDISWWNIYIQPKCITRFTQKEIHRTGEMVNGYYLGSIEIDGYYDDNKIFYHFNFGDILLSLPLLNELHEFISMLE